MVWNLDSLTYVHEALQISTKFGVVPIKSLLLTKRRVKVNTTKLFLRHYYFNVFMELFAFLFLIDCVYISVQLMKLKEIPLSFATFWVFFVFVHPVLISLVVSLWKYQREWVNGLNSMFILADMIADKYKPDWTASEIRLLEEKQRSLSKFFWVSRSAKMGVMAMCGFILPAVYYEEVMKLMRYLVMNHLGALFFGYIHIPEYAVVVIVVAGFPIYMYQFCCLISRFYSLGLIVFGVIWTCHVALDKARYTKGAERYPAAINHPRNAIGIYRTFTMIAQLMQISNNETLGFGGGILLLLSSYMLYFTIGYQGPLAERLITLYGFLLIVIVGTLFTYMVARFYIATISMITSWKYEYIWKNVVRGRRRWEIERRQFALLRPLDFNTMGMYSLNEKTPMDCAEAMINNTYLLMKTFPLK